MSKIPKNRWKELILTEKIFISSEQLEELQWNCQEGSDLSDSLEGKFLGKPQGREIQWLQLKNFIKSLVQ